MGDETPVVVPKQPEKVYAWPLLQLLCGGCMKQMGIVFSDSGARFYCCMSEDCKNSGKWFRLTTASAVVLEEVSDAPQAQEKS